MRYGLACGLISGLLCAQGLFGKTVSDPPPEWEKLVRALSGKWSIRETSDRGASTGEEVWEVGPGGMPLIEEFRAITASGDHLNDYAVVWCDNKAKKIRGLWCASFNNQGCTPFTVTWHGNEIEMAGVYDAGGKVTAWKEVFQMKSPGDFTQLLFMGTPGDRLKNVSTIVAHKR
jgi:hypothetical protein